jgi:hypothetical protein
MHVTRGEPEWWLAPQWFSVGAYFALPTTAARITPTMPPQFPPV